MPILDRRLSDILRRNEADILSEWLRPQGPVSSRQTNQQREQQSRRFLTLFSAAVQRGGDAEVQGPV